MNWLLLIHQIPAKPTYFRAKIWRRLQQVGAVPIKQAAYVMPLSERANEDLSWIAKEIVESGGEAVLLSADFLEGLTDDQVVALFQKARRVDYNKVIADAKGVLELWRGSGSGKSILLDCRSSLTKLRKRFTDIVQLDFFPDSQQVKTDAFLADMETMLRKSVTEVSPVVVDQDLIGKTWVTQTNVYVDRMASAWFIKGFIDPRATFKFIKGSTYQPKENERRFDMVEAEYTHQGDLCTFDVLVQTFEPDDDGLKELAKIIHDIDLKDEAYGMAETPGVQAMFEAIAATVVDDDLERIDRASAVLDGLLAFFAARKDGMN